MDREKLRELALAPSGETSFSSSTVDDYDFDVSPNSAFDLALEDTPEKFSFTLPIQLADQVIKAADAAAAAFRSQCAELKSKTEKLATLLGHAALASGYLYERPALASGYLYVRPTHGVIVDTVQVLHSALALLQKCRGYGLMKRVFFIVPPAAFRKILTQLENSINDVSWLLFIFTPTTTTTASVGDLRLNPWAPKRTGGVIPCGERTDFGYDKDFDKRYIIGKLLRRSQGGYTFVAIDKANGNRVAVNRIEKNKMFFPITVEDVKLEVMILKSLAGQENVVQFYNAFEDNSYVYIAWNSRYTEKDAAIVVRQMLKVAAECHLHGFVHRDMKPENFLFKSTKVDSPLKATDFGLSDFIRPGKKFQDIVGSAFYMAPEVLKCKSGPESDVWSIGVITYVLLSCLRPFWDKTVDGIFKEVLRNNPDFKCKPWPSISDSAKDFVEKLLVTNPSIRLTAAQALSHPWVREGGEASEIPLDISVLFNMRQFVKYSRFKQFALRALASTLDDEELADLRDQFDTIDVDKNGVISLEEMRQALEKDIPWKLKDSQVLEIFQTIDCNVDGLIDFSEFIAATLHVDQLEEHNSEKWQHRSQAAFEKFDVDRDGFITPEELKMHTGLKGSIEPLLEEADIDKVGGFSLSEFRRLLRTASMV